MRAPAARARRIERTLAAAGRRLGGGTLTGTLRRETGREGPGFAPTGATAAAFPFVFAWGEFSEAERAAGLVRDGTHRLDIGADTLATVPRAGDRVTVEGAEYGVVAVETVRPAGADLLYRVTVRA